MPCDSSSNHELKRPDKASNTMNPCKWADFLVTIAVRFIGGIVLGFLACPLFSWRGILRALSHDSVRVPLIWLALCGLAGGIIAVLTLPHWQTPWYKGIRGRDDGHS